MGPSLSRQHARSLNALTRIRSPEINPKLPTRRFALAEAKFLFHLLKARFAREAKRRRERYLALARAA